MMAIIQFLLMVLSAIVAGLLGYESWRLFEQTRETQAWEIAALLCLFFAGLAVIMGISMTKEAEKNYVLRSRRWRRSP